MDKLDTLTLFVRIVERGSFQCRRRGSGVSRPVATAAIKALEVSLGARLLHRTTRHVRPTAEGSLYYQRCVSILAALEGGQPQRRGRHLRHHSGRRGGQPGADPGFCPRCRSFSPATRTLRCRSGKASVTSIWFARESTASFAAAISRQRDDLPAARRVAGDHLRQPDPISPGTAPRIRLKD